LSPRRCASTRSGFYYFRTHAGAKIDLLIDRGPTRIGFELKAGASTTPRDWAHSLAGIADAVIERGIPVYNGTKTFPANDKIRGVSAAEILTTATKW